jgi:hypothetical protein
MPRRPSAWRAHGFPQPGLLVKPPGSATLEVSSRDGGDAERRLFYMVFDLMVMGILSGLVGLVAFEIFQEVRGSSKALQDRYHE